jgi:hypothetical protein
MKKELKIGARMLRLYQEDAQAVAGDNLLSNTPAFHEVDRRWLDSFSVMCKDTKLSQKINGCRREHVHRIAEN